MRRFALQDGWKALALVACALAVHGCASFRLPQIDPTGERIFTDATARPGAQFYEVPRPHEASDRVGLVLCPRASVAPVGSEVVLLASVLGPDQYLRTNEPIHWMLDPGGVGHFMDIHQGSWTDPLVGDFTRSRKIDGTFAINSTSRRLLRLTRGTTDPSDDVEVLRGQAWLTVTSAREGTSHVTVFAPNVSPWQSRTETAQIHWVDAQWCFPSPAIATSGGRQLLTTTVTRQTDGAPRCGWIVRYEVADGPPAGFAPDGARAVEVCTDEQGQASVELFQPQPQPGTNRIAIQVVRPAGLGCPDEQLVVGTGWALHTWSSPALDVRVVGPATGSAGATLRFRLEVSNPGDMAAEGVSVSADLPSGLAFLSANPASEGTTPLQWPLGRLSAGEVRVIAVDFRAERIGRFELCAQANAASGLSARACAAVSVETAELELEVVGPTEGFVGDSVTHEIVVRNRSGVAASGLIIKNRRDRGLEHEVDRLEIERLLGDLGPRQSRSVRITFRLAQAGSLCHTTEVIGPGGVGASERICIEAHRRQQPPPGVTVPGAPPAVQPDWIRPDRPLPPPAETTPPAELPAEPAIPTDPTIPTEPPPGVAFPAAPRFEISAKICDTNERPIARATVGDRVLLMLDVTAVENQNLDQLSVAIELNPAFRPESATADHRRQGNRFTWEGQSVPSGVIGRYALLCVCQAESTSACFDAAVSDASGQQRTAEACIPIAPAMEEPSGRLDVKIGAMTSPVTEGETFSYRVVVTNERNVSDHGIQLAVAFPPQLTPFKWRTMGPVSRFTIRDGVVRFDPVAELAPGGQLEYTIYVRAESVGPAKVYAEAASLFQTTPVSHETTTEVVRAF